jgi:hypothetical protein
MWTRRKSWADKSWPPSRLMDPAKALFFQRRAVILRFWIGALLIFGPSTLMALDQPIWPEAMLLLFVVWELVTSLWRTPYMIAVALIIGVPAPGLLSGDYGHTVVGNPLVVPQAVGSNIGSASAAAGPFRESVNCFEDLVRSPEDADLVLRF